MKSEVVVCAPVRGPVPRVSHFWVAHGPFFTSELALSRPSIDGDKPWAKLLFCDADGVVVNEAAWSDMRGLSTVLPLGPFMRSCKYESGLVHAHLILETSPGLYPSCALVDGSIRSSLGVCEVATRELPVILPFVVRSRCSWVMAVVNYEPVMVKFSLRVRYRSQEVESLRSCPAYGVRLISVPAECFYLRLREGHHGSVEVYPTQSGQSIGVQRIEETILGDDAAAEVRHYGTLG